MSNAVEICQVNKKHPEEVDITKKYFGRRDWTKAPAIICSDCMDKAIMTLAFDLSQDYDAHNRSVRLLWGDEELFSSCTHFPIISTCQSHTSDIGVKVEIKLTTDIYRPGDIIEEVPTDTPETEVPLSEELSMANNIKLMVYYYTPYFDNVNDSPIQTQTFSWEESSIGGLYDNATMCAMLKSCLASMLTTVFKELPPETVAKIMETEADKKHQMSDPNMVCSYDPATCSHNLTQCASCQLHSVGDPAFKQVNLNKLTDFYNNSTK